MNKMVFLLLALMLVLCACGNDEPAATAAPAAAPTVPATQATVPATAPATEPAEPETTAPVTEPAPAEPKDLAKTCIGKTTEDLYALIGEPDSSDYAPSCLGPGEDGNLYYDGFTVYTYLEDGVETVRIVD